MASLLSCSQHCLPVLNDLKKETRNNLWWATIEFCSVRQNNKKYIIILYLYKHIKCIFSDYNISEKMMLIFKKIFWYKVFLIPKRLENIIKIIIRLRYYSFPYFDILIYNMDVYVCVCVCVCVEDRVTQTTIIRETGKFVIILYIV